VIPDSAKPDFVSGGSAFVVTIEKRLEVLQLQTNGVRDQQAAFDALVAKYGAPELRRIETLQNGFGAKFDVIRAGWKFDRIVVTFSGSVGDFSKGTITVMTPA